MATYSFLDVQATISGPGGVFILGSGSGNSEEGIDIEQDSDKSIKTIGADGTGMYSLIADRSGSVTVRLLKTSDANAKLMALYNAQSLSSALWGRNTIVVTHAPSGDTTICSQVAFKKKSPIKYGQDGGINEWAFVALTIDTNLGTY